MTNSSSNPDHNVLNRFPLFLQSREMVIAEIKGPSDSQLDWVSPDWEWSDWSIRENISHVASHLFRWYVLRWGERLFPSGLPVTNEDIHYLAGLPHRQLDHHRWGQTHQIIEKLGDALNIVLDIISKETTSSMRQKFILLGNPGFYGRISNRYPGTLVQDPVHPSLFRLTLEGNLHHSEGEMVTHLFNVQRLKKAQRLEIKIKLPEIGYWTLPDWDTSESH